jgi:molecular chaperone DnaK (HSP70)
MHWALDFGTTHSLLASWLPGARQAEILEFPDISIPCGPVLESIRGVPTAILLEKPDLWAKLGRIPWVQKAFFIGTQARIGQKARSTTGGLPDPAFAERFKPVWMAEPLRPVARLGGAKINAREAGSLFLRELFAALWKQTRQRPLEITLSVPVEAYEPFRAELGAALQGLGIKAHFVDEPVAAAVGYGVALDRDRELLIFDIGGATMQLARVQLQPRGALAGRGLVRAKWGVSVGGDTVDRWIFEESARLLGLILPEDNSEDTILWRAMMLAEARRIKESLYSSPQAEFLWMVPDELRGLKARFGGNQRLIWSRTMLLAILEEKGLWKMLEEGVSRVLESGAPEEVLLTGGSSLLCGIAPWFEARFGRDRVRAWQPFEAVVRGAAALAAGEVVQSDVVVHDYALQTYKEQNRLEHSIVVPGGTRFPTAPDFWRQLVVPTCASGEPETVFRLVVVELGKGALSWDKEGILHSGPVVVPLNESNPVLGVLEPPHLPEDRKPRLELMFGVDADRWLVATVKDLKTSRILMKEQPVVRLL